MTPIANALRRLALVATLASPGTLALPHTSFAYRDCCFARSVPPTLIGVTFHGGIDDVLGRLERAGFQDYDPNRRRIAGLGDLDDTVLPSNEPLAPGDIAATLFTPSIARWMLACGPASTAVLMPMGGHPNRAQRMVAVIAVVADLDLTCRNFENPDGPWHTVFGPAHEDSTLGARVREVHLGTAALRVLAPIDPKGPAARWLAAGGPRWVGFAVEVNDVAATETWLRNEHVPFQRDPGGNPTLRIDPANLDGLLVEFVSTSRF